MQQKMSSPPAAGSPPRSPRRGEVEVEVDDDEDESRRLVIEAQRRWLHDTMGCISGPVSPSETSPQARRRLASSSVMRQIGFGHRGAMQPESQELATTDDLAP